MHILTGAVWTIKETVTGMHPFTFIVVISFLFGTILTKERKILQIGQCELSGISFRELRDYFGEIKEIVVSIS